MATRRGWLATIQWGMLLCASALLAVSTASELLQEGLTKETAEGDLQAAIVIYEKIVAQHADDASVAADAQLHIGMCYEKLGRQEARAAYEDVIALFPDEKQVVALATERLQALQEADELGQQQAGAGPEKTRQMIDRLGQRLADVSSYRGSLAVSLELMGKEIHSQGPMWFQRPNLSRIELTSSLPTGRSVWPRFSPSR